jgi:hypothetical protein
MHVSKLTRCTASSSWLHRATGFGAASQVAVWANQAPPDLRTNGRAPTLDAATIEFDSWRQRLAWAKLGEWRDDDCESCRDGELL